MKEGSIVTLNLANPSEKYWGRLETLGATGITVRGINLASFEDWVRDLTYGDGGALGLATVFFPMHRIERMALDEPIGQLESMSEGFERRVGRPVLELFDD